MLSPTFDFEFPTRLWRPHCRVCGSRLPMDVDRVDLICDTCARDRHRLPTTVFYHGEEPPGPLVGRDSLDPTSSFCKEWFDPWAKEIVSVEAVFPPLHSSSGSFPYVPCSLEAGHSTDHDWDLGAPGSLERPRARVPQVRPHRTSREWVPPEVVAGLLTELGLTRAKAAKALHVSVTLVYLWTQTLDTDDYHQSSYLNKKRWPEVCDVLYDAVKVVNF